MDSRMLTLAAQVESNREVEELHTRPGRWELVKTFVHRGMDGVFCDLVDETGSMRSIDVRVSSELIKDNVGRRPSMSSRSVQMSTAARCLVPSALSPVSPGLR